MKAKNVMTTAVVTVGKDAGVEDAVRLMLDHHVSALPVVDSDGTLVGLVSEGDLMRRVREGGGVRRSWWLEVLDGVDGSAQDYIKARSHRISDVMTRKVISVDEETPVGEIAALLEKRHIKRVPVLRGDKVVGIVSRANLLQALAQIPAEALPVPSVSDEETRRAVAAALAEVPGAQVNMVNFTVENGKVALWGVVDSDFVEKAVEVAVESVPGVEEIEMHLGRLPSWGYGI